MSRHNARFCDFAKFRLNAEEQARVGKEEITLDEIYTQLAVLANYSPIETEQAKTCELALELASVVPSSDHIELIRQLKEAGKKIIFVSDIYLEKPFIEQMLDAVGLSCYDALFVSSEYRKTKHSGRIWEVVRQNIGSGSILHIGDNLHADVTVPKKYGIDTVHYTKLWGERRLGANLSPELVPFSLLSKISFLQKPFQVNADRMVWQSLGTTLGAMILWSFTDWLADHIRRLNIEHIYFCARDAQIIHKVWEARELDKKLHTTSSYLYLSRKVLRFPQCYVEMVRDGKLSDASLTFLVDESIESNDTFRVYLQRIGLGYRFPGIKDFIRTFGSLRRRIRIRDHERLKTYLQNKLAVVMLPNFQKQYEASIAYYRQEGLLDKSRQIAMVDLGWSGTLQLAIQEFRQFNGIDTNKLYGFYYGLYGNNASGRYYATGPMFAAFFNAFSRDDEVERQFSNMVTLLENFHSADHETTVAFTVGADKKSIPVFKADTDEHYHQTFESSFAVFQAAALQTIQKWHTQGSAYGIDASWITPAAALAAMMQVFCSPNRKELEVLGGICHANVYDHAHFWRTVPIELPKKSRHIGRYLYQAHWPCGVMSYWRNNRKHMNKRLYAEAVGHFSRYPELVRRFLTE